MRLCWLGMKSGRGLRRKLMSLRHKWRSYRQARTFRRLEEVEWAVKQIIAEEEVQIAGPVDYARVVLEVEPYPYQA